MLLFLYRYALEIITIFLSIFSNAYSGFKGGLVKAGLMDGIFNAILSQLEAKGLIVRKGT